METLRTFCARHPMIAAAIVAMALLMKLAVPGGFMPVFAQGWVAIVACDGTGPAMPVVHTMRGMTHHAPDKQPAKVEPPCAFAGLTAPAVAATDALLLAILIAFVLATGSRAIAAPRPAQSRHLRPPPRGPPRPA